jgi:hypothetical protein
VTSTWLAFLGVLAADGRARDQEDEMPATLIRTCPLCGLRFTNTPLLELHIREDHLRRHHPAPEEGSSSGTGDDARQSGGGRAAS